MCITKFFKSRHLLLACGASSLLMAACATRKQAPEDTAYNPYGTGGGYGTDAGYGQQGGYGGSYGGQQGGYQQGGYGGQQQGSYGQYNQGGGSYGGGSYQQSGGSYGGGGYSAPQQPSYSGGGGAGSQTHTVQHGETLWRISQQYGTTVQAIKSANGLTSDLIRPGDVLYVR